MIVKITDSTLSVCGYLLLFLSTLLSCCVLWYRFWLASEADKSRCGLCATVCTRWRLVINDRGDGFHSSTSCSCTQGHGENLGFTLLVYSDHHQSVVVNAIIRPECITVSVACPFMNPKLLWIYCMHSYFELSVGIYLHTDPFSTPCFMAAQIWVMLISR